MRLNASPARSHRFAMDALDEVIDTAPMNTVIGFVAGVRHICGEGP